MKRKSNKKFSTGLKAFLSLFPPFTRPVSFIAFPSNPFSFIGAEGEGGCNGQISERDGGRVAHLVLIKCRTRTFAAAASGPLSTPSAGLLLWRRPARVNACPAVPPRTRPLAHSAPSGVRLRSIATISPGFAMLFLPQHETSLAKFVSVR